MARVLLNVPSRARKGDIIEIKTLISHPMESGFRAGYNGAILPRDIIQLFTCHYNDVEVFRALMSPAVAANPFVSFHTIATESGKLIFRWTGDRDFEATESADIVVE